MNKQRKVVITTTYNEMGIIIDTKAEEVAQPNLQPTCNQLATDCISRQQAIEALYSVDEYNARSVKAIKTLPSAQPEEAIPVSWIEAKIERFMMTDDAFSGLTASIIRVMLNEWKKEQEGD